jgi:hypothetical protein
MVTCGGGWSTCYGQLTLSRALLRLMAERVAAGNARVVGPAPRRRADPVADSDVPARGRHAIRPDYTWGWARSSLLCSLLSALM